MNNIVDLTNLHSMTDGDAEMEKLLFDEFYSSFETGSELLRNSMDESKCEIWRKKAHALKGIAINLGASNLAELCKQAQEQYSAETLKKIELLKEIQNEFIKVQQCLKSINS